MPSFGKLEILSADPIPHPLVDGCADSIFVNLAVTLVI